MRLTDVMIAKSYILKLKSIEVKKKKRIAASDIVQPRSAQNAS